MQVGKAAAHDGVTAHPCMTSNGSTILNVLYSSTGCAAAAAVGADCRVGQWAPRCVQLRPVSEQSRNVIPETRGRHHIKPFQHNIAGLALELDSALRTKTIVGRSHTRTVCLVAAVQLRAHLAIIPKLPCSKTSRAFHVLEPQTTGSAVVRRLLGGTHGRGCEN